ncbi:hypothetical protein BC829DRAFT_448138 [Chytridium lagenaria]|nr:hypothetical protein BC829DRAFT_448138 [Chytridium lagenaria]
MSPDHHPSVSMGGVSQGFYDTTSSYGRERDTVPEFEGGGQIDGMHGYSTSAFLAVWGNVKVENGRDEGMEHWEYPQHMANGDVDMASQSQDPLGFSGYPYENNHEGTMPPSNYFLRNGPDDHIVSAAPPTAGISTHPFHPSTEHSIPSSTLTSIQSSPPHRRVKIGTRSPPLVSSSVTSTQHRPHIPVRPYTHPLGGGLGIPVTMIGKSAGGSENPKSEISVGTVDAEWRGDTTPARIFPKIFGMPERVEHESDVEDFGDTGGKTGPRGRGFGFESFGQLKTEGLMEVKEKIGRGLEERGESGSRVAAKMGASVNSVQLVTDVVVKHLDSSTSAVDAAIVREAEREIVDGPALAQPQGPFISNPVNPLRKNRSKSNKKMVPKRSLKKNDTDMVKQTSEILDPVNVIPDEDDDVGDVVNLKIALEVANGRGTSSGLDDIPLRQRVGNLMLMSSLSPSAEITKTPAPVVAPPSPDPVEDYNNLEDQQSDETYIPSDKDDDSSYHDSESDVPPRRRKHRRANSTSPKRKKSKLSARRAAVQEMLEEDDNDAHLSSPPPRRQVRRKYATVGEAKANRKERNRLAAQRSREKRNRIMRELMEENDRLRSEVVELRKTVKRLLGKAGEKVISVAKMEGEGMGLDIPGSKHSHASTFEPGRMKNELGQSEKNDSKKSTGGNGLKLKRKR